eukprot:25774-Rhodomonas_salina.1
MRDCKKWLAFQESQGGSGTDAAQQQPSSYQAATQAAEELWLWDDTQAAQQQQQNQWDWGWDPNAYYNSWFDQQTWNQYGEETSGGAATGSTDGSTTQQTTAGPTPKPYAMHANFNPDDNETNEPPPDSILSLLMLIVTAARFTSKLWLAIMLCIAYTISRAVAAAICPWTNSRTPNVCRMTLRDGTTLFSYRNPRQRNPVTETGDENDPPSSQNCTHCDANQQAMLNTVTSETIRRMFSDSEPTRKTQLNVTPAAHSNTHASDVKPEGADEMLC